MACMPQSIYGMDAKKSFLVARTDARFPRKSTMHRRAMDTWYLFLAIRPDERPSLIKRCQAENKAAAARVFAGQLNSLMNGEVFTEQELLAAIKQEDELTERENQWIRATAPELMDA